MGQRPPTRPPTFDHLRKKPPREERVAVHVDDGAVRRWEEATAGLRAAEAAARGDAQAEPVVAARAERDAARAALDGSTVWLVFRAVGRKAYDQLVRDHPPTEEQLAEKRDPGTPTPAWNLDTFPVALIAASCVEPAMTVEEAQTIWDEWNGGEIADLWMAALRANTTRRVVEMGKASNGTRG